MTSITADWLGAPSTNFGREVFPDGQLNAAQLQLILELDDRQYGRITGVWPASQKIAQLTDDIVEVHVSIGGTTRRRQCTLWLDSRGRMVASALMVDDRHAESYWTTPDELDKFNRQQIVMTHLHGMWSLGDYGAISQTRKFIREHYTETR